MTNQYQGSEDIQPSPPSAPIQPAVSIEHLHVTRGRVRVFNDLNVVIPKDQVTGVLGPSGSGKATLLRAIVGVQRLQAGTVSHLGHSAGNAMLPRRV